MQQQTPPPQQPMHSSAGNQQIFPSYADNPKKGSAAKTVLPIAISILLLLGALYFANQQLGIVNFGGAPTPTPTEAPEPTEQPSPAAETQKEDVVIEVFNGSGVTGQAGVIKAALEAADFTNITVGNADDTTDTIVQYGAGISQEIIDEIEGILEEQGLNPTSELDDSLDATQVSITTGSEGRVVEEEDEEPEPTTTVEPTQEASGSAQ